MRLHSYVCNMCGSHHYYQLLLNQDEHVAPADIAAQIAEMQASIDDLQALFDERYYQWTADS